jgi:hypothetical protein
VDAAGPAQPGWRLGSAPPRVPQPGLPAPAASRGARWVWPALGADADRTRRSPSFLSPAGGRRCSLPRASARPGGRTCGRGARPGLARPGSEWPAAAVPCLALLRAGAPFHSQAALNPTPPAARRPLAPSCGAARCNRDIQSSDHPVLGSRLRVPVPVPSRSPHRGDGGRGRRQWTPSSLAAGRSGHTAASGQEDLGVRRRRAAGREPRFVGFPYAETT